MTDIGDRIRQVREDKGLSRRAFATAIGSTEAKVQAMEVGRQRVDHEVLGALTRNLGIDANWLLLGADDHHAEMRRSQSEAAPDTVLDFIPIPRFAVEASAGPGSLPDNKETSGFYAFNKRWLARRRLAPASLAVVAVRGDSMEPKLSNGDLILVDRAQTQIADGFAYVLRLGDDLLVKHVQRLGPATVALVSANTAYAPREVRIDEFANDDPTFALIGRVVASMHEW